MPMLLDVNRIHYARSDRVKSVDFHPTEPHVIAGLYNGSVNIWNYVTGALVKTFEVTDVPVRCVRYIARKNWFVAGSDDFQLRIFNYNTYEKIAAFEAHPDYIRCLVVHPTLSLVLTGSDDMTIKCWDWEKGWKCVQVFEGHTHYIMALAVNPKDSNTFASACLDHTVKVWSLGNPTANFSLEAHEKGVNYVEYYHGGDKPYLITCGDDRLIKIWDYHSKSCIQTLESHSANVSFAIFHPSLPIIISGSEDGTIKLWNSSTYRLENTLSYGLERAWCTAYKKVGNEVAFGYDEGAVVIKLGREEPSISMDTSGKIVYARNTEVLTASLQTIENPEDGQKLPLSMKELGNTEVYPTSLQHSPNGRFVTVCGDGEYIVYTSLAWRNKAFGTGTSFAWALDSNTYAVLEGKSRVRVYKNFKERTGLVKSGSGWAVEGLHGGVLLGARGNGFVIFWDWETGAIVRRIEVDATSISWSSNGSLVAITGEDSFYLLKFDRDAYNSALESEQPISDEGVEEAFELVAEVSENVSTSKWVGDCFIYTTSNNKLSYLVGDQSHAINHFDTPMYLLGYLPSQNRVYLADKDVNVFSYNLSVTVIDYQSAILRGDMETAASILPSVPADQLNRVARFLETQELRELAMEVSNDPDHKFELAIQLDDLDAALELTRASPEQGSQSKWKTVGDKALAAWRIDLAEECFKNALDLPALLLIYTSLGDRAGIEWLAKAALDKGLHNIAFTAFLQLGDVKPCIDLLVKTDRVPEAAFLARTYAPSQASEVVSKWKAHLASTGKGKVAKTIADPAESADLFEEDWSEALRLESNAAEGTISHGNGIDGHSHGHDDEDEDGDEEMVDAPELGEDSVQVENGDVDENSGNPIDQVEKLVDGVKELIVGGSDEETEEEQEVQKTE
ncbi:coatomer beta subunit [Phaffia rhodozyma]|uniref:Coatomer subunit beta' n=1 Tax=Phaffia rhodozyma TaxID=264483 RepID=A0A0F7SM21_PHARH|nr:coatomer beta subunit [Phaffia rhodozyma]